MFLQMQRDVVTVKAKIVTGGAFREISGLRSEIKKRSGKFLGFETNIARKCKENALAKLAAMQSMRVLKIRKMSVNPINLRIFSQSKSMEVCEHAIQAAAIVGA